MKRRLSFLIALVMVLSLLPAMSVSAATQNRIHISGGTVADDYEWGASSTDAKSTPFISIKENGGDDIPVGTMFSLYLSNAEFDVDELDEASGGNFAGGAGAVWSAGRVLDTGGVLGLPIAAASSVTAGVQYTMTVRSKTVAEVELLGVLADGETMRIPLPIKMVGEGPATVSIADTAGTLITPTSSITVATGTSGTTTTTVTKSTQTFSRTLNLGDITITETTPGTIDVTTISKTHLIELYAPSGFEWVEDGGVNPEATGMVGYSGASTTTFVRDSDDKAKLTLDTTFLSGYTGSARNGAILITGLQLTRTDSIADTTAGDVRVRVKVPGGSTDYITVGVFANRAVTITAEDKALPEIVSGAYTDDYDADKAQVLDVWIKESSAQAWNAEGDAIFTLPKGVKFRAVEVKDSSGFLSNPSPKDNLVYLTNSPSTSQLNDGVLYSLKDDELVVRVGSNNRKNATTTPDKLELKLRCWVTVEPGFTGDITFLTHEDNEAFGTNLSAVVAKAIDPITVSTTSTDIQLGYMNIALGDIIIKENQAGAIPRSIGTFKDSYVYNATTGTSPAVNDRGDGISENLQLYIGGYSGSGAVFKTKGEATVTSGDIVLDDYKLTSDIINVVIKRESTTASEIKLSGMTMDADRNVPQGKLELRVKGNVVANWHSNRSYKDGGAFGVEYLIVSDDYVNVITAAPDQDVKYTTEVSVIIGSTTLTANKIETQMDVAPFIQDDYTMVPARWIAEAIGISSDMVRWDANTKAVTILDTNRNRTSQFTQGSNIVKQNGMDIGFDGPSAMNVQGRVFLPFRALGEIVLGCPVDWDPETRTAYFNKQTK